LLGRCLGHLGNYGKKRCVSMMGNMLSWATS
jgi:hypothetical protein